MSCFSFVGTGALDWCLWLVGVMCGRVIRFLSINTLYCPVRLPTDT